MLKKSIVAVSPACASSIKVIFPKDWELRMSMGREEQRKKTEAIRKERHLIKDITADIINAQQASLGIKAT